MMVMDRTTTPRQQRDAAGEWLRTAREAAGLSQRELAQQLGVTPASISSYETGRNGIDECRVPAVAAALRKGVVETRRALGFYVDEQAVEDEPLPPPSAYDGIRNDPALSKKSRDLLLDMYDVLRTQDAAEETLTRFVAEQNRHMAADTDPDVRGRG